jgi:hypothetical protein
MHCPSKSNNFLCRLITDSSFRAGARRHFAHLWGAAVQGGSRGRGRSTYCGNQCITIRHGSEYTPLHADTRHVLCFIVMWVILQQSVHHHRPRLRTDPPACPHPAGFVVYCNVGDVAAISASPSATAPNRPPCMPTPHRFFGLL